MTPLDFAAAVITYRLMTSASVTSWGRTPDHNHQVGGVPLSPHITDLAVDVVYDSRPDLATAHRLAADLGLTLLREATHDHLQPTHLEEPPHGPGQSPAHR